jgi:hypothetical protein
MSCTKTSNNKHFNCPPRMDDGRHFTDYRPHCHMENLIQHDNGMHNSFQTRLFLTQNATKLIELNRKEACSKNCCGPCQSPYQISTTMPEASALAANYYPASMEHVLVQRKAVPGGGVPLRGGDPNMYF